MSNRSYKKTPMSGLDASEAVQQIEGKLQEAQQYAEAEEAAIDKSKKNLLTHEKKNLGESRLLSKELSSAVTGGVQDSLSSVATFPERTT